jgi:hypothetical protein
MKDLMQKVMSFITFEFALDSNCLGQQFTATHTLLQKDIAYWSTNSTRQKIISKYWFEFVLSHFVFLFSAGIILLLFMFSARELALPVVFVAGIITFMALLLFNYWPNFYSDFLPKLETIKETFERKQLEQLEKCKRAQLSNLALVLVYYVFDKLSGNNSLRCNDHYAAMLTTLYGVDQGSVKKNLELIFGNKQHLSELKATEISNRFEEARNFFEAIEFTKGLSILSELEQKLINK